MTEIATLWQIRGMPKRPLITTDCHIAPPATLADELPERMRSKVTHLENRSDGVYLVRPEQIPEGMREALESGGATGMTALLEQGIKVDPDDGTRSLGLS